MTDFKQEFIEFAISRDILRFGEFKTKAGRLSPYFFNAGLFNDGDSLHKMGQFYAKAILAAQLPFDMLFGPAYKGIPLVSAISITLSEVGNNYPFCFNRKEAKDHGEGGNLIGSPLSGKVLIIDDVISAGTSIREAVDFICAAGAKPCGVIIALDRMEQGNNGLSAIQEIKKMYDIPVISIINLDDVMSYLRGRNDLALNLRAVENYRAQYGIV
jgi:orotate phosphoribosyltransferase